MYKTYIHTKHTKHNKTYSGSSLSLSASLKDRIGKSIINTTSIATKGKAKTNAKRISKSKSKRNNDYDSDCSSEEEEGSQGEGESGLYAMLSRRSSSRLIEGGQSSNSGMYTEYFNRDGGDSDSPDEK